MKQWWFVVAAVVMLALVVVPRAIRFQRANLEKLELTDEVRSKVPGSFVALPTGKMHYELAGPDNGNVVVLVTGFSTTIEVWNPAFTALKDAGFRVLRYDHFGRGYSDRTLARYDPEFFDQELLDLLNSLNLHDKVDLVGEGMGGTIAAAFVNRHPARSRKLVMIDPDYRTGYEIPFRLRVPLVRSYSMVIRLSMMADWQMDDFVHPERFPHYAASYREHMRYRGFRRAIFSTMTNYWTQDTTAEYRQLGKTRKPVMLFWGVADESMGFGLSTKVREEIPQAEFHPVKDAGHLPAYEQPEFVNPILIGYLRRN